MPIRIDKLATICSCISFAASVLVHLDSTQPFFDLFELNFRRQISALLVAGVVRHELGRGLGLSRHQRLTSIATTVFVIVVLIIRNTTQHTTAASRKFLRLEQGTEGQPVVMDGGNLSAGPLDGGDGLVTGPADLDLDGGAETVLSLAQELDTVLDRTGLGNAGIDQILDGQRPVPVGGDRQAAHVDVVLDGPDVDGDHLLGVDVGKAPLGQALVQLGLSTLKGRVDAAAGPGLLALVSPSRRLALGRANAPPYPAAVLARPGIVGQVVEGEEGDHLVVIGIVRGGSSRSGGGQVAAAPARR